MTEYFLVYFFGMLWGLVMSVTQETHVAGIANQIISTTAALYGIGQSISQISSAWTNLSAATKLNAFPTIPATTTGGLGATPDASPVTTNPINPAVAPGTLINQAISATDIASMLTYLQGVANAINGVAVTTNGAAVQLVAKTLGS